MMSLFFFPLQRSHFTEMALARVKSSQTKPTLRSAWGGNFVLSDHFTKLSVTDDVWTRSCCCVVALCSAFSVSVNHSSIAQKVKKHYVKITRVTFTSDRVCFFLATVLLHQPLLIDSDFHDNTKNVLFWVLFFFAVKWIRNIVCLFSFFFPQLTFLRFQSLHEKKILPAI